MKRTKTLSLVIAALFLAFGLSSVPKEVKADAADAVDAIPSLMWVNHLDFLATYDSVVTSFGRVLSGFNGFSVEPLATAGDKEIAKGLIVPPGYLVNGVRVCYELSSTDAWLKEIALTQMGNPPTGIGTELISQVERTRAVASCVDSMIVDTGNSQIYPEELIDPSAGPLHLKLGLSFTNTPDPDYVPGDADKIVVTAVGLHLFSIDDGISDQISELQDDVEALNVAVDGLESDVARLIPFVLTIRDDLNTLEEEFVTHGHMYLTGKGEGHNNTEAYSGLPSYDEPSTLPPPPKEKKKKKSKKKKRK